MQSPMHTDIFDYKTQAEAARVLALENVLTNSIVTRSNANERIIILYTVQFMKAIIEIRTYLYTLFVHAIRHALFTTV